MKARLDHSSDTTEDFVYKLLEHLQRDQAAHSFHKQENVGVLTRKSQDTGQEVPLGTHAPTTEGSFSWREFEREREMFCCCAPTAAAATRVNRRATL